MLTPQQLKGTGVALVTPFNNKKEVDHPALERLVNFVIDQGIDFLVALGTTAETPTLSSKEKNDVMATIIKVNNKRVPVIMGMGANNTSQLIDALKNTDFTGIDGLLSVTPYYNKPNQEGLYQHYKAISEASPLPIILYNVPSRTGANLKAETTLRLARDFDNIIAVKEASGDMEQIMDIIRNKPEGFNVLSGDDALTLAMTALGGDGVISVIANSHPAEFTNMVRYALNEEMEKARREHYRFTDLIKLIFSEGNPAGIKALLKFRKLIENELRLPLVPVSATTFQKLKDQFDAF